MLKQTNANKTDEAILQGLEVNGLVRPEDVISAAQDPKHPWHDRFEWNDAAAAHQHRIETARGIIRNVRFRVVHETFVSFAPRYVRTPEENETGYRQTKAVASQKDMATVVLNDEINRIRGNVERARALAHEFNVAAEFEIILQGLVVLQERLKMAA